MKRIVSLLFVIAFVLPSLIFPSGAAESPYLSARSAVLINGDSGEIVFEKNAHEKLPMASTTKIMTAYTVLNSCDIWETVTVHESAVGVEGSSAYLREGEKLTVEELLYALLLQSANDAAAALAVHISGNIDSFASLMNENAEKMGLKSTSFSNPHGLDNEDHFTTAHDLAKITAEAMKNDDFRKIVSTKTAKVGTGESVRTFVNHNRLLREYPDCIGVKTGFTRRSGRCLVSCAERDGICLICVTLNAPDDWNDHKKLLDFGFEAYETIILSGESGTRVRIPAAGTKNGYITAVTDGNVKVSLLKENGKLTVKAEYPPVLFPPYKKGDRVGKLCYYKNGKKVKETELYID